MEPELRAQLTAIIGEGQRGRIEGWESEWEWERVSEWVREWVSGWVAGWENEWRNGGSTDEKDEKRDRRGKIENGSQLKALIILKEVNHKMYVACEHNLVIMPHIVNIH